MPLVNDVFLQITDPIGADEERGVPLRTIVLVHGLGSSGEFWSPLVPLLAESYRVVQVDVPGFGRSGRLPAVPQYDLVDATHKVADALAEAGIHEYALIGHSFGGGLSALYALEHPERVWALGLLAPAGFLKSPNSVRLSWVFQPFGWLSRVVSRGGLPVLRLRRVRDALFAPYVVSLESLTLAHAQTLALASTQAVEGGRAGVAIVNLGLLPRAAGLAVPTFVGWGNKDRIVDSRLAQKLGESIQGSVVALYPDAGHALLYEPGIPEQLASDLLGFLVGAHAGLD